MITQNDIHNTFVNLSDDAKIEIIKKCGCDVGKIKKMEKRLADSINLASEMITPAAEYMSKEI